MDQQISEAATWRGSQHTVDSTALYAGALLCLAVFLWGGGSHLYAGWQWFVWGTGRSLAERGRRPSVAYVYSTVQPYTVTGWVRIQRADVIRTSLISTLMGAQMQRLEVVSGAL